MVQGRIEEAVYLGEMAQYRVAAPAAAVALKVYQINPRAVAAGGACALSVAAEDVVVLPHVADA